MNIRAATVSLVIITVITSFCADYRMFFIPFAPPLPAAPTSHSALLPLVTYAFGVTHSGRRD